MTASVTLHASQRAAGRPVRVSARALFDQAGWNANDELGVGITTSATTPTNKSAFAHADTYAEATPVYTLNSAQRYLNNVIASGSHRVSMTGDRAIDANLVVGRYLWAYAALADGTFQSLSSSYHVT